MSQAPTASMASSSHLPNAAAASASTAMIPERTSVKILATPAKQTTTSYGTNHPMRRDSMEKREALLQGKGGSRHRRRWENDRLLTNPWAEPPLPSDWEVRPTYPTRTVPYYLAPLWDAAEFQRSVEAKLSHRRNGSTAQRNKKVSKEEEAASNVPKEVRAKLKRARAAKGLLQQLEEDVRAFVVRWNEKELRLRAEGLEDALVSDSEMEDDEIVFVGRNGAMHDSPGRKQQEVDEGGTIEKDKLVFEGLLEDKRASFGRWLVHEIGAYYGLKSWSETVDGEPKMRQAFVGHHGLGVGPGRLGDGMELPKPLYAMV
jgi:hypothetical protein